MSVLYFCKIFELHPIYTGVPLYQLLGYGSFEDFIEQTEDPFTEMGDLFGMEGLNREWSWYLMMQAFFIEMYGDVQLKGDPEIGNLENVEGTWYWADPDHDTLYTFTYSGGILGTLTNNIKINLD